MTSRSRAAAACGRSSTTRAPLHRGDRRRHPQLPALPDRDAGRTDDPAHRQRRRGRLHEGDAQDPQGQARGGRLHGGGVPLLPAPRRLARGLFAPLRPSLLPQQGLHGRPVHAGAGDHEAAAGGRGRAVALRGRPGRDHAAGVEGGEADHQVPRAAVAPSTRASPRSWTGTTRRRRSSRASSGSRSSRASSRSAATRRPAARSTRRTRRSKTGSAPREQQDGTWKWEVLLD